MDTTVVNLNDYVEEQGNGFLVRIDRMTKWGNPFRIGQDGDRAAVIEKYRQVALEKDPERGGAGPLPTRQLARLRSRLPLPAPPVPRRRP